MKEMIQNRDDLTDDEKKIVFKSLQKRISISMKDFNFRTTEKFIKYFKYNKKQQPDNKKLFEQLHNATTEIDEERLLVLKLMRKKNLPVNKQIKYFVDHTGHSRATFFRIKKSIKEDLKV